MTTKWKDIISEIVLWSVPLGEVVRINGSDIVMSPTPLFPSCLSFDFSQYWTSKNPNTLINIKFKPEKNLTVSLEIEDRQRALVKRTLRSTTLAYEGSPIRLELDEEKYKKYFLTISQQRDLESYSECKNYPTSSFENYRGCDEDFVYTEMKKYNFMPFWAAKTLDEVTKIT